MPSCTARRRGGLPINPTGYNLSLPAAKTSFTHLKLVPPNPLVCVRSYYKERRAAVVSPLPPRQDGGHGQISSRSKR